MRRNFLVFLLCIGSCGIGIAAERQFTKRDLAKAMMSLAQRANKHGMAREAVEIDKLAARLYAESAGQMPKLEVK